MSANEIECVGGETKITLNPSASEIYKETIIPKHILIFRKDLTHEGLKIISGTKEIITMNLWATSKKKSKSIVIVSFSSEKSVYCLSEKDIMLIPSKLEKFCKLERIAGNVSNVLYYEEKVLSAENFDYIYKILTRQHIELDNLKQIESIISHYEISYKNILMKLISETSKKNKKNKKQSIDFDFSKEIIYCSTLENKTYLCEKIKKERLPYIPFTIVFAEGTLTYDANRDGEYEDYEYELSMAPVYASFSECDNLLFTISLIFMNYHGDFGSCEKPQDYFEACYSKHSDDNYDALRCEKKYISYREESEDEDDGDDIEYVDPNDDYIYCAYFGLELCADVNPEEFILNAYDQKKCIRKYTIANNKESISKYKYYNFDEDGKMFLGPEHFPNLIEKIKKNNLFNKIAGDANDIQFILPQATTEISHSFCNETVYGNTNIITVYGFLRME
jgi:hypothetical protein